jgi:hypothetical protein
MCRYFHFISSQVRHSLPVKNGEGKHSTYFKRSPSMQAIYTISYELVHIIQKKWAQSKSDSYLYQITLSGSVVTNYFQPNCNLYLLWLYHFVSVKDYSCAKLFRWTKSCLKSYLVIDKIIPSKWEVVPKVALPATCQKNVWSLSSSLARLLL